MEKVFLRELIFDPYCTTTFKIEQDVEATSIKIGSIYEEVVSKQKVL